MYDVAILEGRLGSIDNPVWEPLEKLLPLVLCGPFMWMNSIALEDGAELQAYKHSQTRRYLLIDAHGDTWERLGGERFRRMRHADAIEQVLTPWWLLQHAGEAEREALSEALHAAWDRGNGDAAAGAHILPSSPAAAMRSLPSDDDW